LSFIGTNGVVPQAQSKRDRVAESGLRVEIVTPETLEKHAAAWQALADNALEPNAFYEPWMLLPALRAFAAGESLIFALVWRADAPKLAGFFPLSVRKRYKGLPARVLALWKHVHCFLATPLVDREHGRDALLALFDWARDDWQGAGLLDFGCVRIFPPRFVNGVITLYHALQAQDVAMAVDAYESWGFKGLNKETIEVLNMWAGFLYGPVLDDSVRPIGTVDRGEVYGREIASKVHRELQKVGGIKVPREFVFMDRAALGLGSVFLHLKAEMNWHDMFQDMIRDFDVKELTARQKTALKKLDLSHTE